MKYHLLLPTISHINMNILDEDFISGIRKISEEKISTASGPYYSLYKALQSFSFTMGLVLTLIMTSVNNNFLLTCWEKVIQVLFCKSKGNFNIKKLQIIQLLKANLNMYMQLIRRKIMVRYIIDTNHFP